MKNANIIENKYATRDTGDITTCSKNELYNEITRNDSFISISYNDNGELVQTLQCVINIQDVETLEIKKLCLDINLNYHDKLLSMGKMINLFVNKLGVYIKQITVNIGKSNVEFIEILKEFNFNEVEKSEEDVTLSLLIK